MKIILASKSPRRKELLATLFEDFDCMPSQKEEKINKKMSYKKVVKYLSEQKAEDIFSKTSGERVVIGSDTIVVYNGKIYGKPKNEQEAFNALSSLSGKTHIVATGICIIKDQNGVKQKLTDCVISKVTFNKLSKAEINSYIQSGEPMDKAGSYGCQGIGKKFVKKINGDFFAVMGLPVNKLYNLCKQLNIL